MSADNETSHMTHMGFATDLRRQFEELVTGTPCARDERTASSAALALRQRWLVLATVAMITVAAATILVFPRLGDGPSQEVPAVSTAVSASPSSRQDPAHVMRRPPSIPDVSTISALTIDSAGRPWLSGSQEEGEQSFAAFLEDGEWVQIPVPAEIKGLQLVSAQSPSDMWAPVTGGFAHWDGTIWQKASVPWLDNDVVSINDMAALSGSDIWAVGRQTGQLYRTPEDGPGEHTLGERPLTMHWDGMAWAKVKVPAMPGRTSTLWGASTGGRETWAVGGYEVKLGEQAQQSGLPREITRRGPIAVRWDGERWIDMQVPNAGVGGTALGDVLVLAPDDVWVLGWTDPDREGETVTTYLAHWDGAGWQQVPTPRGRSWGDFNSISGPTGDDIWLGGSGRDGIGYPVTAHWNGKRWVIYSAATFASGEGSFGVLGRGEPEVVALSSTDVWFNVGFTRIWYDDSRSPEPVLDPSTADPVLFHWDGRSWAKVDVPF